MGTNEKKPIYGCFKPVHWFKAQLNSRICERMSAPNAANSVVGIHSQPITNTSMSFHQQSVQRMSLRPVHTITACRARPGRLCAASCKCRNIMPSTVVGVPAISLHSFSCRRAKYCGSTRRPRPNLTNATTIENHIAKATTKYSTFSQPKPESPSPNQYNGPIAQHHATQRHASTASIQLRNVPIRSPRFPVCLTSLISGIIAALPE